MSVRAFADYLGVSARTVSKWEAGGCDLIPRPDTQAILDTALRQASAETRERFEHSAMIRVSAQEPAPVPVTDGSSLDVFVHPIDGKQMVLVAPQDTAPPSGARADSRAIFLIDVTPVTNEEYRRFVVATGQDPPLHWLDGSLPPHRGDHPVTHVTHRDATAYANWATKQLPSTWEWEAASSGSQLHAYPWGDQPNAMKCNVRESAIGDTTPVRRYHSGISSYGVYDLAGNVWEWCRTQSAPGRYALKGSAFTSPLAMAAATQTNDAFESMFDDDTGLRCVASPPPQQ